MAASFIARINIAFKHLEQLIWSSLGRRYPPGYFCLAGIEIDKIQQQPIKPKLSLKDIVGNGFLWAVPKHRRSLEKRHKRLYGHPDYYRKILQPKTNIKTCNTCGDDYEMGALCPTCYKKVIDETKQMQEAIQNKLKLEPVEKEIVVLYEDEKNSKPEEFWEGKRVVEMKKQRPAWFSKNLLQETTQKPSNSTDVKPSELG